jgi:hypothetical protein
MPSSLASLHSVAYPGNFFFFLGGGVVQLIQLGTESRQNGQLKAVAP